MPISGLIGLTWRRGRLEPIGLQERLDTLSAVLDGVPQWVWEDRR